LGFVHEAVILAAHVAAGIAMITGPAAAAAIEIQQLAVTFRCEVGFKGEWSVAVSENEDSAQPVLNGTRDFDLPMGWYEFPLKSASNRSIFNHAIRQVWNKATRPPEPDARVLFTPTNKFCIEYRGFHTTDSKNGVLCIARYVRLTRMLRPNIIDLHSVSRWRKGAKAIVEHAFKMFESSLHRRNDGSVDMRKITEKVASLMNVEPDQALLRANLDWIFKGIANTIYSIYREPGGLEYFGMLYKKYKGLGGLDDRQAFQVNMGLLFHLYKPAISKSTLSRLDGNKWRTEREIINAWEGMAKTRHDAWRYLQVMIGFCNFTIQEMVPMRFRKVV
jgi:hypothetical protein